ncbi:hypothetical protein LZL87_013194 [Fusarium oxysporum]|nr:hypothetical protein LZL87_013194 [Fusarium oxysporum]
MEGSLFTVQNLNKAIIPVNGMADMYREMAFKGGVPEKQFSECYPIFWNWSNNLVEDSPYGTRKHPYFDDYWRSKIPTLNKIRSISIAIFFYPSFLQHRIPTPRL